MMSLDEKGAPPVCKRRTSKCFLILLGMIGVRFLLLLLKHLQSEEGEGEETKRQGEEDKVECLTGRKDELVVCLCVNNCCLVAMVPVL